MLTIAIAVLLVIVAFSGFAATVILGAIGSALGPVGAAVGAIIGILVDAARWNP